MNTQDKKHLDYALEVAQSADCAEQLMAIGANPFATSSCDSNGTVVSEITKRDDIEAPQTRPLIAALGAQAEVITDIRPGKTSSDNPAESNAKPSEKIVVEQTVDKTKLKLKWIIASAIFCFIVAMGLVIINL